MKSWYIAKGTGKVDEAAKKKLKDVPPWRKFGEYPGDENDYRPSHDKKPKHNFNAGRQYIIQNEYELDAINTALLLRRPLLVTGAPGVGKSSLAEALAYELDLGDVLTWPITSKSTLKEGLYSYDALGRLQAIKENNEEGNDPGIGAFIELGPLGTALLPAPYPKVLLIDEIDKSDLDLPNDLLHIFERGYFTIPELARIARNEPLIEVSPYNNSKERVKIEEGVVTCCEFPIVILTSNGEREFPAPFLRRCIRLEIKQPDKAKLKAIVDTHFGSQPDQFKEKCDKLVESFIEARKENDLATDQLLNAMYLVLQHEIDIDDKYVFANIVLKNLSDE